LNGRGCSNHQCKRKNGFGPEGLYCKAHSPEAATLKAKKQREKYDAARETERKNSIIYGPAKPLYTFVKKLADEGGAEAKELLIQLKLI